MKRRLCLFFTLILAANAVFPETADEYLKIGERYFAEGRFHEARTAVENAIQLNPNSPLANFHLGVIYYHLDGVALALEHFSRAIELDNTLAEAFFWRAGIYEGIMNDHVRALEDYDMAIYLEPQNDRYHWHRAFFLSGIGDFTQALAGFNRAIEIKPLNYENFQQRGVFFGTHGLYEQALDDLNEAIKLNSESVRSFTSRGFALFRLRRYEEAMKDYDAAVRVDSNDYRGFFERGHVNILLGRYREAILDFAEVIRINPHNSDAYFNRSVAYRYLASLASDPEQTRHYLQRAHEDEAMADWLDGQQR